MEWYYGKLNENYLIKIPYKYREEFLSINYSGHLDEYFCFNKNLKCFECKSYDSYIYMIKSLQEVIGTDPIFLDVI